jgi:lysylphosphatidylglycerol synthetase-like protein (DUF2156 family)
MGRTIAAAMAGYLANGLLVAITEQLLASRYGRFGTHLPPSYFVIDLITQCIFTVIGGYLCALIARTSRKTALAGMIGLALLVGMISVVASWKTEPHWYAIALLLVYAPCAWMGWMLRQRGGVHRTQT